MSELKEYVSPAGISPFHEWIESLDEESFIRVQTALVRIESGNIGDVKPVGKGVSERRITFGSGYRIYFGQDGADLILLLTGGTKKRQQRDIKAAKAYWADYKLQKREELKRIKAEENQSRQKRKKGK